MFDLKKVANATFFIINCNYCGIPKFAIAEAVN